VPHIVPLRNGAVLIRVDRDEVNWSTRARPDVRITRELFEDRRECFTGAAPAVHNRPSLVGP
jgi:hypothetical protein